MNICKDCRGNVENTEHYDAICQECGKGGPIPEDEKANATTLDYICRLSLESCYKVCLSCSSEKQLCQVCGCELPDGLGLDFSKEIKPEEGVWYDAKTQVPPLSLDEEHRDKAGWIHSSIRVYVHTKNYPNDLGYGTGKYSFDGDYWDAGICDVLHWMLLPKYS